MGPCLFILHCIAVLGFLIHLDFSGPNGAVYMFFWSMYGPDYASIGTDSPLFPFRNSLGKGHFHHHWDNRVTSGLQRI